MTYEENIRAILDANLSEIKDEIKDCITDKIVSLRAQNIVYHGISDINDIKDWIICGYRVEELYKLALILRDKRIEDVDLQDFNNCFLDGYKRAHEEAQAAIQESINRIMNNLTEEV